MAELGYTWENTHTQKAETNVNTMAPISVPLIITRGLFVLNKCSEQYTCCIKCRLSMPVIIRVKGRIFEDEKGFFHNF